MVSLPGGARSAESGSLAGSSIVLISLNVDSYKQNGQSVRFGGGAR